MTKVMIVEDNLTLLESISFELEMRGFEVMQAGDGESALNLLFVADTPPDIIVSDIAMPKVDGYQFLESVRHQDRWNDIPFIFLTAFDSQNAVRIGKELGVDDYLTKPFQPDDLVVAMENKLKRVGQFRKAAERRLDEARNELLHMLTHELRTPLTLVFGGAEALGESLGELPDETAYMMLDIVRNGAKRMNRLVNNILYLIAIDTGQMEVQMTKFSGQHDIKDVIVKAYEAILAEPAFAAKNIQLDIRMADEALYVRGLTEYLVMMVAEILRNALVFSPNNNRVTIDVQRSNDDVLVTITDNGPGIPEDQLETVWGRFVQLDRESQEQQGTGVGLALVRESARLHGGDCSIQSQQGNGTQVTLRLPLASDEEVVSVPHTANTEIDRSSLKA